MNVRDQNRYRMLTSVRSTLASHETDNTWTKIPALVTALEELDSVIAQIGEQLEATATPSGASASKATALQALVVSAHEIASALHACATAAGNDELAAEVDFSLSALFKGRETDLVARCSKILSLATEQLDNLDDYNVTQAKLTALGKKIEAFKKVQTRPRQGVAKKAAANKALPRLFLQARNILTRRVDRLMVQFKASAPEFFAEFETARKIVNQPGSQGTRATNATPSAKAA